MKWVGRSEMVRGGRDEWVLGGGVDEGTYWFLEGFTG